MIYDLAILGGGPAGYSAAFEAVKLGLSVILFEKQELGGTCLNRGCVPTKFLAHTAELYHQAYNGHEYGIISEKPVLDYLAACKKKEEVVSELRIGLEQSMKLKKIEVVNGYAEISDNRHITCGGETYEAKNILIATGSIPAEPLAKGAVTSDEILEIKSLPKSVKIIGGGVIAAEFAHIFSLLGVEVTIAIRGDRILRKWDKEIAVALTQNFKKRGIKILTNQTPEQLSGKTADIILSAAGRKPNLCGVNTSLVETDESGGIIVDRSFRTKTENIFAAGDVISKSRMLAHTAMEQGKIVARIAAGKESGIPSAVVECIYTSPEVASVGFTEAEAKEKGAQFVSAKSNMRSNARTLISGADRSFIKILADKNTKKIIGAQLFCNRASDIADELALAINHGFTADDLLKAARPHPSFCEAITDAAEALSENLNEV